MDGSLLPIGRGNNRYAKNTACAECSGAVERGFLYCPPCIAARIEADRAAASRRREARREAPGPNLLACCGKLSQVLTNPLRMACCGRALEIPTPQSTPEGRD